MIDQLDFDKTEFNRQLSQFTGTENYHATVGTRVCMTDGVKFVSDKCGAYWLADDIGLYYSSLPANMKVFCVVELSKHPDNTATLDFGPDTDEEGNLVVYKSIPIEFTDFPLDSIRFYVQDNVVMLPSEY